MDFTISLQQKTYLFQEPVFATFKLTAVQKTVKIPLNYDESKGLIVNLYDSSKKPLMRSTAADISARISGRVNRGSADENSDLVDLPKGKTVEWTENVLSFVDIPCPGTYNINAEFVFAPSGIKSESPICQLIINPCNTIYVDVLDDYICAPQQYILQINKTDQISHNALMHIAGCKIFPAFSSISLQQPLPEGALIAKADFVEGKHFEHDLFRRFASIDKKTLVTGYLDAVTGTCRVSQIMSSLPDNTSFFARPVQHNDKGFTVFLNKSGAIESHRFTVDGKLLQSKTIASLKNNPFPSSGSASGDGIMFLVHGTEGSLPVMLITFNKDGSIKNTEVLNEKQILGSYAVKPASLNVSILEINPLLAAHESPDQCIIILLLITDNQKQIIKLVKVPWNQDASAENTVEIVAPPIEPAVLPTGEKIIAGRTVKVSSEMTFSMLITLKGNILFSNGGAYAKCASIDPTLSAAAILIRSNQGDVYLLFPEKNKGLGTQRLFTMPRMD